MQANTLKLKIKRKKRKTIGRGGKKGTYSGKGNKGQKARSGAKINPLFEGGRSSLVERMKKLRGFKSAKPKAVVIDIAKLDKAFKDGETVNKETLIKSKLLAKIDRKMPVKILGSAEIKKKLTVAKEIKVSASAKSAIEKAGGKIETEKENK